MSQRQTGLIGLVFDEPGGEFVSDKSVGAVQSRQRTGAVVSRSCAVESVGQIATGLHCNVSVYLHFSILQLSQLVKKKY